MDAHQIVAPPSTSKPVDIPLDGILSTDSEGVSGTGSPQDSPSKIISLEDDLQQEGRAVFGGEEREQKINQQLPVGAFLNIDARQNLATKVMANGVEVIVAGDKTLTMDGLFGGPVIPSMRTSPPPITLPAATLSHQMLLLKSPDEKSKEFQTLGIEDDLKFHLKTYFTTFTYYNTLLQEGEPVVRTSKETVSNVVTAPVYVSGNFVEKTKINLETSTYLATQTFTRTIGDFFHPEVVTSEEIITQVVVTEAPSITRSRIDTTPTFSTIITKTYFTTFTYYKTYGDGLVETETVISSDIVTETSVPQVSISLPVVSITKAPNIGGQDSPHKIFATKTYFTTSTYLTTILKGGSTVIASHTEVTSNVVTETLTSVLNTDDILRHKSSVYPTDTPKFESTGYVSLGNDLYKELRTLFATYTHYTTLHNGRVRSSEVTKTQILTSTITTTHVPVSLLIRDVQPEIIAETTQTLPKVTEGLFDSIFSDVGSSLDPSYSDTLTTPSPSISLSSSSVDDILDSHHIEATPTLTDVTESEKVDLEDSTIKATLLLHPDKSSSADTTESLLEENISSVISDTKSESAMIDSSSVRIESPELGTLSTKTNEKEPSPPVRISDHLSTTGETQTSVKKDETEHPPSETSEDGGSGFGIGLSPMLTAVAGLIGNTFVGKLAGQAEVGKIKKIDEPLLPKSAIVASEKGPLLIPVGGVGESMSIIRDSTVTPEQGFIPLRQPELESSPILELHGAKKHLQPSVGFSQEFSPISLEKFGPTFIPPATTESGFTAMTKNVNPTKVSVISGEETIFFGGFNSLNLPPPGLPASSSNSDNSEQNPSSNVQLAVDEKDGTPSHLLLSQSASQDVLFTDNKSPKERPVPQPSLIEPYNYYVYDDEPPAEYTEDEYRDSFFFEPTDGVKSVPDTEHIFPSKSTEDSEKATVLQNSPSLDRTTTIFETLFTRPSEPEYDIGGYNDDLIPYIERGTFNKSVTENSFQFLDGFPIPVTEVVETTRDLRTMVSTIADSTSTVSLTNIRNDDRTPEITPHRTKTHMPNTPLMTVPTFDDSGLYRNSDENSYDSETLNNEPSLDYREVNEISRVLGGHRAGQDIREPQKVLLCQKNCQVNEVCKILNEEHICACIAGFSKRNPTDLCSKSKSFQVDIVLDKLSDDKLSFTEDLKNSTNPTTRFLIEEITAGVGSVMQNSEMGGKYQTNSVVEFDELVEEEEPKLVARVKIDIESDSGEDELLTGSIFPRGQTTRETSIQSAIEDSLRYTNYSLGGSKIYTGKEFSVLAATDFDECRSEEHNDCHENAECVNLAGSFSCVCKPGFSDVSRQENLRAGRHCVESNSCSYCNYHGICQEEPTGEMTCICNEWFSGEVCEINMKVMLIAVVSLGAFLLLLLFIFIVFCCCRSRKEAQVGFLRQSPQTEPSTLDRRAMIPDSSSENSEDLTRLHVRPFQEEKLPPMPSTPQADYSIGKRSGISCAGKDRSVSVQTIPPVLIPRVKGYNTATRGYSLESETKEGYTQEMHRSREASLVDILDGCSRNHELHRNDREAILSVHSFSRGNQGQRARESYSGAEEHHSRHHHHSSHEDDVLDQSPVSRSNSRHRHHHHHLDGSVHRSGSIEHLDERPHDLVSDYGTNSLHYGNRTVSQARSYDETTVRAPIRNLRGESFRSREVSSQILSDGMPTNAERDGNSTIVYPQMQLYKPLREADSMSDLTGNHKSTRSDLYE